MIDVETASVDELERAHRAGLLPLRHIPEFHVWHAMRGRCLSVNHSGYRRYGGRGIKICDQWQADFWCFLRDVGRRPIIPGLRMSLDRKDNDGNYEPSNVRWASDSEQIRNQYWGELRHYKGEYHSQSKLTAEQVREIREAYASGVVTQTELAEVYGIANNTISLIVQGRNWKDGDYQPFRSDNRRKLTAEQVLVIRAACASGGVTQRQLAKEYGVSESTISQIVSGDSWKHLPLDGKAVSPSKAQLSADLADGHANLAKQMEELGYG